MTEFKIESIQQVIIHDLVHEDIENFLHHCYADCDISKIWVDGIIIDFFILNPSCYCWCNHCPFHEI